MERGGFVIMVSVKEGGRGGIGKGRGKIEEGCRKRLGRKRWG
jgi:hypothetical protein